MSAATDFYVERDRLLAELADTRAAFDADRNADTKAAYDAARHAYASFRSAVRALAYVQRPEGDAYRVDAERLIARGDYDPQEA